MCSLTKYWQMAWCNPCSLTRRYPHDQTPRLSQSSSIQVRSGASPRGLCPCSHPTLHYIEPYAGSAACFFTKAPARHEVLNDLNGSICTLFRVLRNRGDELAEAIMLTPWCEEEYERVEKDWVHEDEVEHARRFLVRCWQAHGGTIYQVSGWKHNGLNGHAYPVRLWRQLPERLLATVDRLRDAEIRTLPALDIICPTMPRTCCCTLIRRMCSRHEHANTTLSR